MNRKSDLLKQFEELPPGRSARNNYPFNANHAIAVYTLRWIYMLTPKEIEQEINVSVYRIHKLELWGRRIIKQTTL